MAGTIAIELIYTDYHWLWHCK